MHADEYGIFMFYWYSSVYVVVEGFKELKLRDPKIEQLLQSPKVDALRLDAEFYIPFPETVSEPEDEHFHRKQGFRSMDSLAD